MPVNKITVRLLVGAVIALMPLMALAQERRPIIGVNVDVSGDSRTGRLNLGPQYVDAVTSAGGLPLMFAPVEDPEMVAQYAEICDGFLFTGGRDISPQRYGETTTHSSIRLLNPRREQFDFAMIDAALKTGKPVLGICLGSQELNVALGGSMLYDLPTQTSSTIDHKPGGSRLTHDVHVTTGTRLHDILGTTTLAVNSIHHQACDRLGSGVLVMARAPDGVVESFEVQDRPFAVGIQWHPEALTTHTEHLAIYKALVDAAREHKQQSN